MDLEFKLKNVKDTYKPHQSNTHLLDHDSDSSDDESKEVHATEFVWSSKAKSGSVPSLKPIQKNRQEELKFTFDISKCDRIFDELLKNGNIRLSHAIPLPEELKRHAYCKWNNSTSHATNDCNVFRRQVQSAINEGRLVLSEMQIDKAPFPVHMLESKNPKVLIRQNKPKELRGRTLSLVILGR